MNLLYNYASSFNKPNIYIWRRMKQTGESKKLGNGLTWTPMEDEVLRSVDSEAIHHLGWDAIVAQLPGRTKSSARKRYMRLQKFEERGESEEEEDLGKEVLGSTVPVELVDRKLWPGAAAEGWRVHEPRQGRYVYAHSSGARFTSSKQVLGIIILLH